MNEPHRNIGHIRKRHIDVYVKNYVSMCQCGEKNKVDLVEY